MFNIRKIHTIHVKKYHNYQEKKERKRADTTFFSFHSSLTYVVERICIKVISPVGVCVCFDDIVIVVYILFSVIA